MKGSISRINSINASFFKRGFLKDLSDKNSHFGYTNIPQDRSKMVKSIFDNVSTNYDMMNDAMSFGIHRIWKSNFVEKLSHSIGPEMRFLDMAGGTGDIAFRIIEASKNIIEKSDQAKGFKITVGDINEEMLQVGKRKALDLGYSSAHKDHQVLDFQVANAENLPFKDNSFDVYTISFGIRNCSRIDQVLKEAYRVLDYGGRFLCLEFSPKALENVPLLKGLYDRYSEEIIPMLGQLLAADFFAYKYLIESIKKFPDQEIFANQITESGFKYVEWENMTGGIVAIHQGYKL